MHRSNKKRDQALENEGRRNRRKRRAPPGWVLTDLVQLSGITARTISHYRKQHLFAAPPFRGSHTRYGREHLVRLLFIKRLRREEALGLGAIKQRMDAMTSADIEAFVITHITSDGLAAALGVPKTTGGSPAPPPVPSMTPEAQPLVAPSGWLLIEASPTLKVLMRRDASATDLWLVERLQQYCAAAAAGSTVTSPPNQS